MLAREEYAQRSYEGGPHLLHRGHTRSPEITRGWPRLGHPTSCTEKLCRWYDGTLKPLNVRLTCILADIYKAAWIDNTHKEELDRKASTRSASSPCAGFHRDSPRLHESRCSRSAPSLHARGSSC